MEMAKKAKRYEATMLHGWRRDELMRAATQIGGLLIDEKQLGDSAFISVRFFHAESEARVNRLLRNALDAFYGYLKLRVVQESPEY